jgi:hypothetical protein
MSNARICARKLRWMAPFLHPGAGTRAVLVAGIHVTSCCCANWNSNASRDVGVIRFYFHVEIICIIIRIKL